MSAFLCLLLTVTALLLTPARAGTDELPVIRDRLGGGNMVTHLVGAPTANLYQALKAVGARSGRMDSYGWRDLDGKPTPHDFDAAMAEAFRNGITPVILLEYEGSYQDLDPPQPVGSYADWYAAGRAYATRFRPGGDWARENGAGKWGVTVFSAINEPDVQASIPRAAYREALAGLADGVHSVDPALRVVPGGFATCNSHGDPTFRGYGNAIADLLEDGRLDGLDLHTYYNARWFPLDRGREFSAQSCFDKAKAALGIRRDINFYATEFNVARGDGWDNDATLGALFLTAVWDNLGVQKADGSSATVLAFPWNLSDTGSIEGPAYAMAAGADPWKPDVRAKVLKMVADLAGDMRFVALDPRGSGSFVLEGAGARLVVFQDRPGWSDSPGADRTVAAPPWARSAELWGWEGLRRKLAVTDGTVAVKGLAGDETFMLRIPRPD
ncbi:MAG TPA: hypothetical protein PKD01_00860 [Mesorhizobium sp.]|nr:hypothetical protein [Mesorhizobium sp.]